MGSSSNNWEVKMKFKKKIITLLALISVAAGFGIAHNFVSTVQAKTNTTTFPKKMRGTWKSKPIYTFEEKHTNKNMAVAAIKMKVSSRKAKWHFIGHLPSQDGVKYDHKTHTLRLASISKNGLITLKGHGPFRDINYLRKSGKKLILDYNGGFNTFKRIK